MNDIIPSAGLAARRTAAVAVLADYQRDAQTADVTDRAMWAARLAGMLGYVLAAIGTEGGDLHDDQRETLRLALADAIAARSARLAVPCAACQGHNWRCTEHRGDMDAIALYEDLGRLFGIGLPGTAGEGDAR